MWYVGAVNPLTKFVYIYDIKFSAAYPDKYTIKRGLMNHVTVKDNDMQVDPRAWPADSCFIFNNTTIRTYIESLNIRGIPDEKMFYSSSPLSWDWFDKTSVAVKDYKNNEVVNGFIPILIFIGDIMIEGRRIL